MRALWIVGGIIVAAGAGVGIAYLAKVGPFAAGGSAPTLPSPGGASTAAPQRSAPHGGGNPLDAISGALNALGGVANAVDHMTGGAIGDFVGRLTGGFGF